MSVYVNVLRHAVGRLSDNTLDQRERVYAKARQTVLGKLQDLKIAPENAMRSDHLAKLEAAIALVEAEFSSSGDSSSPLPTASRRSSISSASSRQANPRPDLPPFLVGACGPAAAPNTVRLHPGDVNHCSFPAGTGSAPTRHLLDTTANSFALDADPRVCLLK